MSLRMRAAQQLCGGRKVRCQRWGSRLRPLMPVGPCAATTQQPQRRPAEIIRRHVRCRTCVAYRGHSCTSLQGSSSCCCAVAPSSALGPSTLSLSSAMAVFAAQGGQGTGLPWLRVLIRVPRCPVPSRVFSRTESAGSTKVRSFGLVRCATLDLRLAEGWEAQGKRLSSQAPVPLAKVQCVATMTNRCYGHLRGVNTPLVSSRMVVAARPSPRLMPPKGQGLNQCRCYIHINYYSTLYIAHL